MRRSFAMLCVLVSWLGGNRASGLQPYAEFDAATYGGGAFSEATLRAADKAIAMNGIPAVLHISTGAWRIRGGVSFSSMTNIQLGPGARFVKSRGGALTFADGTFFSAPQRQVFVGFRGDDVVLPSRANVLPQWFGAVGNGVANDQPAFAATARAMRPGMTCFIPNGDYLISSPLDQTPVVWLSSGIVIVGESRTGVTIRNPTPVSHSFVIGENSTADTGGIGWKGTNDANRPTFITDVAIRNLHFSGPALGLWVVFAKRVVVENISTDGKAAVAVGNDGTDDSFDIDVSSVYRTADGTADWYTVGFFRVTRGSISNVSSEFDPGNRGAPAHLQVSYCSRIRMRGISTKVPSYGQNINVTDSTDCVLDGFSVWGGGPALVGDFNQFDQGRNMFANGIIHNARTGILVYGRGDIYDNIVVDGSLQDDLAFGGDAGGNTIQNCKFAKGTVSDPLNVKANNKWSSNVGLP